MKYRALFVLAATMLLFIGTSHATTPSLADPFHDNDAAHDTWAELEAGDLIPMSEQMPLDYPELLLNPAASDPVALDPSFGGSGTIYDGFGTTYQLPSPWPSQSTDKNAHRVIRTSDGGAIVAALVPALDATTSPTTFNLGLARYSANGTRVKWTLAQSQYTDANKNWLVYPNVAAGNLTAIHDLQEFDGYLYIIVTRRYSASDTDAHVIKVKLDGSYVNRFYPLNGNEEEAGAGLVFDKGTFENRMLFVGRRIDADGKWSTVLKRYSVSAGNTLPTLDTGFGGSGEKTLRFNACGAAGNQPCSTAAGRVAYVPGSTILNGRTVIYVAGDMRVTANELHTFVYKLDMNGNLDTTWAYNGGGHAVRDIGGRRNNELYGLTLGDQSCTAGSPPLYITDCRHELFLTVAAESPDPNCKWDIAVAKLKTDGYYLLSFGSNGWVGGPPVGGSGLATCSAFRPSTKPVAAFLHGQRLVVAGNQSSVVFGASGVLKIYDATSGALHFSDSYRADNQDTYFRWVEKAGTDSFYVAGTVTDPTWVTTSRFRIVPITDHIFSDGMESP